MLLTDEVLNLQLPEKGSASHLEACRDYDEKIDFLQTIRSRSGVDKTHHHQRQLQHHRKASGIGIGAAERDDEDANVNLLRMSGTSFFRTGGAVEKANECASGEQVVSVLKE